MPGWLHTNKNNYAGRAPFTGIYMVKIFVDKKRLSLANQSDTPLPVIAIDHGNKIEYAHEVEIINGKIKYVNPCGSCGSVFIETSDYAVIS